MRYVTCEKLAMLTQKIGQNDQSIRDSLHRFSVKNTEFFRRQNQEMLLEGKTLRLYKEWRHYSDGEIVLKTDIEREESSLKQSGQNSAIIWRAHPKGMICTVVRSGRLCTFLNSQSVSSAFVSKVGMKARERMGIPFPTRAVEAGRQAYEIHQEVNPAGRIFQADEKHSLVFDLKDDKKIFLAPPNVARSSGFLQWEPWLDRIAWRTQKGEIVADGKTIAKLPDVSYVDQITWGFAGAKFVYGYYNYEERKTRIFVDNEIAYEGGFRLWLPHPQGFISISDDIVYLNDKEIYRFDDDLHLSQLGVHPDGVIIYEKDKKAWVFHGLDQ